jgi:hypothetical protein
VNKYREGKVKSTLIKGVKKYLKLVAYKQSKPPLLCGDGVPFA